MTTVESAFQASAERFLALTLASRSVDKVEQLRERASAPAYAIPPVIVEDYRSLSVEEIAKIAASYHHSGIAHLIVKNAADRPIQCHPLFDLCQQLADEMHLLHPLTHPLEGHPEAEKRFGTTDHTVKIYNLPKPVNGTSYREVAESSDAFEVHLDGLGSGGSVETVILYMDSAPLFGGFTFFYDLPALGAILAENDPEAFRSLFLPDAFTAVRPRGKGAIKVTTPVFYLNEMGKPQVFFRKNSGEYRMFWREGIPALQRARLFLERLTSPFAPGSCFVPFMRPGVACLSRNTDIAHGRTAFLDGDLPDSRRVLSRKWFMKTAKDAIYKHVPGITISPELAELMPERFGADQLVGEWLYDATNDRNHRVV